MFYAIHTSFLIHLLPIYHITHSAAVVDNISVCSLLRASCYLTCWETFFAIVIESYMLPQWIFWLSNWLLYVIVWSGTRIGCFMPVRYTEPYGHCNNKRDHNWCQWQCPSDQVPAKLSACCASVNPAGWESILFHGWGARYVIESDVHVQISVQQRSLQWLHLTADRLIEFCVIGSTLMLVLNMFHWILIQGSCLIDKVMIITGQCSSD